MMMLTVFGNDDNHDVGGARATTTTTFMMLTTTMHVAVKVSRSEELRQPVALANHRATLYTEPKREQAAGLCSCATLRSEMCRQASGLLFTCRKQPRLCSKLPRTWGFLLRVIQGECLVFVTRHGLTLQGAVVFGWKAHRNFRRLCPVAGWKP